MASLTLIRFATLFIVAALSVLMPDPKSFKMLVVAIAGVHYALGYLYSTKQIKGAISQPSSAIGLLVLIGIAYACFLGPEWMLTAVFSFHLVFNEVYVLHRGFLKELMPQLKSLRVSSIALNLLLYMVAARSLLVFFKPFSKGFAVATLVAACFYAVSLWRSLKVLKGKNLFEVCGLELLGVATVAISIFHKIDVYQIVLYHVTFWSVLPLLKMAAAENKKAMYVYIAQNVIGLIVAVQLTPLGFGPYHFSFLALMTQFRFWSFMHIWTAFALSNAHPGWIIRVFQPSSAYAVARQQSMGAPPPPSPARELAAAGKS